MKTLISAAAFSLLLTASSFAHSPVNTSNPADGSTLSQPPETLTLTLAEPGRFMKVEVTHTTMDGSASRTAELEIPSRSTTDEMDFTPPSMGAGNYLVEWRVLGEDGHAMDGTVTYTVTAE
jgi:methionine-rich copper-binding protein CopC